jgi:A/G-specific adenine glycosylase
MEPNQPQSGEGQEAQGEGRGELIPPAGAFREEPEGFRRFILDFYRRRGRDFAWRRTRDPYRILVSELMLQQTQTSRVARKYPEFLERFPDFPALAAAPLPEVLEAWRGLGYNRRAVALKEIAGRVVARPDGSLPRSREELEALPMIGANTAGSILAFAFDIPTVFVETNIRRVYLHHFFPEREQVRDRELLPLIEETLDRRDPRRWYYALMDYGVFLKERIPNPNRRSSAYRRQAPFEGSRRQLRGRILRELGDGRRRGPAELAERTAFPAGQVGESLAALEREGFLVAEPDGRYRIRD